MPRTGILLAALVISAVEHASAQPVPSTPVAVVTTGLPNVTREWELLVTPTGSMEPTLGARTYLLCQPIRLLKTPPSRGEIVAFDITDAYPNGKFSRVAGKPLQTWISRAVAVAGDRVELTNGELFVNGQLVSEPYADLSGDKTRALASYHETVVPADSIYVLSDNRGNSIDSRLSGTLPAAYVKCVVRYISSAKPGSATAAQWSPR